MEDQLKYLVERKFSLWDQRQILLEALSEIESVSTDQHAVGIAKAALAKVEE